MLDDFFFWVFQLDLHFEGTALFRVVNEHSLASIGLHKHKIVIGIEIAKIVVLWEEHMKSVLMIFDLTGFFQL